VPEGCISAAARPRSAFVKGRKNLLSRPLSLLAHKSIPRRGRNPDPGL